MALFGGSLHTADAQHNSTSMSIWSTKTHELETNWGFNMFVQQKSGQNSGQKT